jgi:hypothetical protein
MKKYTFIPFALVTFLIISCDRIDDPLEKKTTTGSVACPQPVSFPADSPFVKKVLLEDFTGHYCSPCYYAQQNQIVSLHNTYGERFIAVGIHAGALAELYPSKGLTYDFRTAVGNDYYQTFGTPNTPNALVNRKHFSAYSPSGIYYIGASNWIAAVDSTIDDTPEADIRIINNYDPTTRTLCTHTQSKFLNSMSGTFNIVALIIEDSIDKPQAKDISILPSYQHRHVLRDAVNSAWGDTLVKNNATANVFLKKSFPSYVVNSSWNASRCATVVFIYDVSNYRIVQVEEKKIM